MPRVFKYCAANGGQKARAARMQIGDTILCASRAEADSLCAALRSLGFHGSLRLQPDGRCTATRVAATRYGCTKAFFTGLAPGDQIACASPSQVNTARARAYQLGIRLTLRRLPAGLRLIVLPGAPIPRRLAAAAA